MELLTLSPSGRGGIIREKRWQGGRKRAYRAAGFYSARLISRRLAVHALAILVLLGSLTSSWHQSNAEVAASSDLLELQLLSGLQANELEASICHHGDGNAPGTPLDDQTLPRKKCPLCLAFHHLPPIPNRIFSCPAYRPFGEATLLPDQRELAPGRDWPDQTRPRAPPTI